MGERRILSALSSEKGGEVLGLAAAAVALLLLASLVSHYPADPSFLHETTDPEATVANWIGPIGAHLSAGLVACLGVVSLLLPLVLGLPAWRLIRGRRRFGIPGRGVGTALLLAACPPLLDLVVGLVPWRGEALPVGGVVGSLVGAALERRFGFVGALLVLVAVLAIGAALAIQTTLAEVMVDTSRRVQEGAQRLRLSWARRRRRLDKEKSRERVVAKHLKRVAEAPERIERLELPVRVVEKPGRGGFSVRKRTIEGAPTEEEEPKVARAATKATKEEPPATQGILFDAKNVSPELPPANLLNTEAAEQVVAENELVRLGELIQSRCAEFGVDGTIEGINPGPVVTVFELRPGSGVKVSRVVSLQDELAMALKAEAVRIDRVPGRSTLGIEVPNAHRSAIHLGYLLAQPTFRKAPSVLTMSLGTNLYGQPYYADLAAMPHLLVAGATGAGKSVGLQGIITSILYKATRDEVQFILIDPKRVELSVYSDIPHLKAPVVVEPKKAANALRWAVREMERRYRLLAEVHARTITSYNRLVKDPEVRSRVADSTEFGVDDLAPLPYYVVVIDELADLMMVASSEVEASIARLAQMARAIGIHLIVATQRPSVDVLTGTIKANFPCRISYTVASRHDSRTILDQVGAEKLLGRGDMLFVPPGSARVMRLHGALVTERETEALVKWLRRQGRPELDHEVLEAPKEEAKSGAGSEEEDELFDEAARLVVAERKASASFLQRRMRIGFSRAARLVDLMEREGLLGPAQGSKPRDVLVPVDYFSEVDATHD